MNQFTTMLFDLDGTLVNTNGLVIKALQYTLHKHLGLQVTEQELRSFFGEPLNETLARYSADKVDEMLETFRAYDLEYHYSLVSFFPGVPKALKKLKELGVKLAIVTSKQSYMASRCNHLAEIEDLFEAVVTFDDVTSPKPDAEPILKALAVLGVKASEKVLMVGDSTSDILAAARAGVKSALVSWSTLPPAILEKARPDIILDKFEELLNLV